MSVSYGTQVLIDIYCNAIYCSVLSRVLLVDCWYESYLNSCI